MLKFHQPTSLLDFRYGRKKIFYISAIGQLAAGVSVAFVKNYVTFVTLTYIYGIFGSSGAFITGYVLGKYRACSFVHRNASRGSLFMCILLFSSLVRLNVSIAISIRIYPPSKKFPPLRKQDL